MKALRITLILFVSVLMNAQLTSANAFKNEFKGKTLYTQVNMHSLKNKHIFWTNYSIDTLIPVNTKVTVKSSFGDNAVFKIHDTGQTLSLKNDSRSGLSGTEWIRKNFSEKPLDLNKFTADEQKAIRNAEVKKGMSKEAVAVSRGFPPAHVTPSLEKDEWMFWETRWNKTKVSFEKNKVSDILQ